MEKLQDELTISVDLEQELRKCTSLPSLPVVAQKIIALSKDPDVSLGDVSSIISGDPGLASKLLKVVNSPIYSQRRAVNNIREALTLVGLNAALSIALSFSLLHSSQLTHINSKRLENYWKRSILAASISRFIGKRIKLYKLEDLFLASMLQDIGILVLESLEPSPYLPFKDKRLLHSDRLAIEKDSLGVEHSFVGAWLLDSWGLSEKIISAVKYSHSLNAHSNSADEEENYFHYCVNFSGSLADIWLEDVHSELYEATKEAAQIVLGLDAGEFIELIAEINNELSKISDLFDINLDNEIDRGKLIDEARELTMQRSVSFIKDAENSMRYVKSIERQVKNIEEEIQHDHLTKIYNRKYIDKQMAHEFDYANTHRWPLSLVFIDLDDFKKINDTYGHIVGDKVLTSVAEFYSKNIRDSDVIARYGGDEFLMLLPGATMDTAIGMLTRLLALQAKELKVQVENTVIVPTVSMGVATHMDKHTFDNLESFIRAADKAVYKAKSSGKNCVQKY